MVDSDAWKSVIIPKLLSRFIFPCSLNLSHHSYDRGKTSHSVLSVKARLGSPEERNQLPEPILRQTYARDGKGDSI